eukprot:scaffold4350_cov131-Skeletonema_menzelii.AAC.1
MFCPFTGIVSTFVPLFVVVGSTVCGTIPKAPTIPRNQVASVMSEKRETRNDGKMSDLRPIRPSRNQKDGEKARQSQGLTRDERKAPSLLVWTFIIFFQVSQLTRGHVYLHSKYSYLLTAHTPVPRSRAHCE